SVELLERAYGFQSIAVHIAACRREGSLAGIMHRANLATVPPRRVFGKAIVYALEDVEVSTNFGQFVNDRNANAAWPMIADVPRPGTKVPRGEPLVTVFADATTYAHVLDSLRSATADIYSFFKGVQRR